MITRREFSPSPPPPFDTLGFDNANAQLRQYAREKKKWLLFVESMIIRMYYSLIIPARFLQIINIARTCKAHSTRMQCIGKTCHAFLRWGKITFASADFRLPFGAHNNSPPRHRGILSIRLSLPRANAKTRCSNKYPGAPCKSDHDLSRVAMVTAQSCIPRKILAKITRRISIGKVYTQGQKEGLKNY